MIDIELNDKSSIIYKDLDIVLINIKELNIKNIVFLYYDSNYIHGYSQYQNLDIFTLSYQLGDELLSTSGKFIEKIRKDYLFSHNIDTEGGSSGCPIILFTKEVIGIHKGYSKDEKLNVGIFIGEIMNKLNEIKNFKNEKQKKEINILKYDKMDNNLIEFNKKFKLNIKSNTIKLNLNNKYNNCWEYLPNLTELKELDLRWKYISNIKFLEKVKFEKLEKLDLSYNNISNYNILEKVNFNELKELDLSWNHISDIKFLEKVKFEKLEKLYLTNNKNISNYNILEQVNFKELKEIDLSWNNISDIKLLEKVKFEKLEELSLGWNKISNYNILEKVNFKELKELDLRDNNISDIKFFEKVKFKIYKF